MKFYRPVYNNVNQCWHVMAGPSCSEFIVQGCRNLNKEQAEITARYLNGFDISESEKIHIPSQVLI